MTEIQHRLAPGIFDNHVLKLWHDWQALTAQVPALKTEWQYERDESGTQLAGPGESLSRTIGNVRLIIVLGGDGQYTPRAEMIETHGAKLAGADRVKTSVITPRTDDLFPALAYAEEAAGEVGQPEPPAKRGRGRQIA